MHETKTAVERRRIVRKNSRVRVRAKKQGGQEKEGGKGIVEEKEKGTRNLLLSLMRTQACRERRIEGRGEQERERRGGGGASSRYNFLLLLEIDRSNNRERSIDQPIKKEGERLKF